jgi:hypothetical protein
METSASDHRLVAGSSKQNPPKTQSGLPPPRLPLTLARLSSPAMGRRKIEIQPITVSLNPLLLRLRRLCHAAPTIYTSAAPNYTALEPLAYALYL